MSETGHPCRVCGNPTDNEPPYCDRFGCVVKRAFPPGSEESILRYFKYEHLKSPLREISAMFADVAMRMVVELPRCAERTAGLRKLLEAKDCAVRAALPEDV